MPSETNILTDWAISRCGANQCCAGVIYFPTQLEIKYAEVNGFDRGMALSRGRQNGAGSTVVNLAAQGRLPLLFTKIKL